MHIEHISAANGSDIACNGLSKIVHDIAIIPIMQTPQKMALQFSIPCTFPLICLLIGGYGA